MDGAPSEQAVRAALAAVLDPEIRRPITELGMVGAVATAPGLVEVTVLLTTSACPLRDTLTDDVRAAVAPLAPGAAKVAVDRDRKLVGQGELADAVVEVGRPLDEHRVRPDVRDDAPHRGRGGRARP